MLRYCQSNPVTLCRMLHTMKWTAPSTTPRSAFRTPLLTFLTYSYAYPRSHTSQHRNSYHRESNHAGTGRQHRLVLPITSGTKSLMHTVCFALLIPPLPKQAFSCLAYTSFPAIQRCHYSLPLSYTLAGRILSWTCNTTLLPTRISSYAYPLMLCSPNPHARSNTTANERCINSEPDLVSNDPGPIHRASGCDTSTDTSS